MWLLSVLLPLGQPHSFWEDWLQFPVWAMPGLPRLGSFSMCTDVNAWHCLQELCEHRKWVCTESWVRKKNLLPHLEIEPAFTAGQTKCSTSWTTSLPLHRSQPFVHFSSEKPAILKHQVAFINTSSKSWDVNSKMSAESQSHKVLIPSVSWWGCGRPSCCPLTSLGHRWSASHEPAQTACLSQCKTAHCTQTGTSQGQNHNVYY